MKGTFKESEIEIIDLSRERKPLNQMNSFIAMADAVRESFFGESDIEKQNRAMKTSIALLEKCLDEAIEDRDRYKRQLDELNIMFDKYIRREKIIQGKGCWECSYCDPIFRVCKCRESDNYNELVGSECRCEKYKEYKPDA